MIKKILILVFLIISNLNYAYSKDKYTGKGPLTIDDIDLDYFLNRYLKTPAGQKPLVFWIAQENGRSIWSMYWYCPTGNCREGNKNQQKKTCEREGEKYYKKEGLKKNIECFIFAKKKQIVWDTGSLPDSWKLASVKGNWDINQLKNKLIDLGFNSNKDQSNSSQKTNSSKQKVIKDERSIAISWEGYQDLIAGTVKFNEVDFKGKISLLLPNNDGNCKGSYILQEDGIGTWKISCSNKMGAAGTLRWEKNGSVTGSGFDYNENKVKFTLSKKI